MKIYLLLVLVSVAISSAHRRGRDSSSSSESDEHRGSRFGNKKFHFGINIGPPPKNVEPTYPKPPIKIDHNFDFQPFRPDFVDKPYKKEDTNFGGSFDEKPYKNEGTNFGGSFNEKPFKIGGGVNVGGSYQPEKPKDDYDKPQPHAGSIWSDLKEGEDYTDDLKQEDDAFENAALNLVDKLQEIANA